MLQFLVKEYLVSGISLLAIVALLLLREYFKPVHQKWRRFNFKSKMPPGPPGIPIYGNLLQFFKDRDAGRLVPYVRASPFDYIIFDEQNLANTIEACGSMSIWRHDNIADGLQDVGDAEP